MISDVNAHISNSGRNILHRAVAERIDDPDWVEALLASPIGLDVDARTAQVSLPRRLPRYTAQICALTHDTCLLRSPSS